MNQELDQVSLSSGKIFVNHDQKSKGEQLTEFRDLPELSSSFGVLHDNKLSDSNNHGGNGVTTFSQQNNSFNQGSMPHSFSSGSLNSHKFHDLNTNSFSLPHVEHCGEMSQDHLREMTKLPKMDSWQSNPLAVGMMMGQSMSNQSGNLSAFTHNYPLPGDTQSNVDPLSVFTPLQIQTLRHIFRATIEEHLIFHKSSPVGMLSSHFSSPPSSRTTKSFIESDHLDEDDDDEDDGTVSLSIAEKKLVRHSVEERWPDGIFPCPKDVKYNDVSELVHVAVNKILSTKVVENPQVLKSLIKKQISRVLTNKRRQAAIKSNPEMREKSVRKMKRWREKLKDNPKSSNQSPTSSNSVSPRMSESLSLENPGSSESQSSQHPIFPPSLSVHTSSFGYGPDSNPLSHLHRLTSSTSENGT
eukprot:c20201_g4_i1.p1 GENE.c20201_g4_i1~~c20201_g4_i1.p1  ORF type:complete len:413 (-),score=172.23 c20201_g4_i1:1300-2538(-)